MKKVMLAAVMAATIAAPAMANNLTTSGDDLAVLSTQATTLGFGGMGIAGGVAFGTIVLTTLVVAGSSSSSTTATR